LLQKDAGTASVKTGITIWQHRFRNARNISHLIKVFLER